MRSPKTIDLTELPSGERYEDRYGSYIEIFKQIAHLDKKERVVVLSPPWSWVPLLRHLMCEIVQPVCVFDHCPVVAQALVGKDLDRTMVEVLCSFRPETADCLWKVDIEWDYKINRVRQYPVEREFIVTTNGAYHREEVKRFLYQLKHYQPTKKRVVLVPCAADKPYPAELHKKVLEALPDDYYLMNATGVLGLVPQDMWPVMPWYDSGIPNQWRLFQIAKTYFQRYEHDHIVVYLDFYAHVIADALKSARQFNNADFILGPQFRANYEDLLSERWLVPLKDTLHRGPPEQ